MGDDVQEAITEYLEGGGSATKQTLAEEIDADDVDVSRALGKLVTRGELEEHPEIDGAFRLVNED